MVGIGIGDIRRAGTAKTKLRSIIDQLSRLQAQSIDITNLDYQGKRRSTDHILKMHEETVFAQKKAVNQRFIAPIEPNPDFLQYWVRLDGNGRYMTDLSGNATDTFVFGNPIVCNGVNTGEGASLFLNLDGKFDRIVGQSYIRSPNTRFSLQNKKEITFQFRIYPKSLSDTGDNTVGTGQYRTILAQADGTFEQENICGYTFFITPTGEFVARIVYNGELVFDRRTATNTIVVGRDANNVPLAYDIAVRANFVNSQYNIVINTAQKGTAGNAGKYNPAIPDPYVSKALFIGCFQGRITNQLGHFVKQFHGGIQDLRIWSRFLTDAELVNYYNNKLTIASVPFNFVARAGKTLLYKKQDPNGIYNTGVINEGVIIDEY